MGFHGTAVWTSAFLLFLAQVGAAPAPAPAPCHLQGHLVQRSHRLLRDMGGNFPARCLQDNVVIAFPAASFASSAAPQRDVGKVVYESLSSIDSLLGAEHLPTEWDQQKLDDFQNIVYRQVEESRCMRSGAHGTDDSVRAHALKTYFQNIATVLKEKNYSYCSWEVVRKELLLTLQFILQHNSDSLVWTRT